MKHLANHLKFDGNFLLKRGQQLVQIGDVNTNIYYLERGTLRIYTLYNEEEMITRFGYQHDFITALDSFLNGKATVYCIEAIRECAGKWINKQNFFEQLEKENLDKNYWTILLQTLVLQQLEREQDILIPSPEERFSRVLLRSPQLFQQIPLKYIANYLRMRPETLSRLRRS